MTRTWHRLLYLRSLNFSLTLSLLPGLLVYFMVSYLVNGLTIAGLAPARSPLVFGTLAMMAAILLIGVHRMVRAESRVQHRQAFLLMAAFLLIPAMLVWVLPSQLFVVGWCLVLLCIMATAALGTVSGDKYWLRCLVAVPVLGAIVDAVWQQSVQKQSNALRYR